MLARFDTLDVTVIRVFDDEGTAGLDAEDVARVSRLSEVAWALGTGPVVDVRLAGLRGDPVPSRIVVGTSDLLTLDAPVDGQAYVAPPSQAALGLSTASGAVETAGGTQIPVAGRFSVSGPLSELQSNLLVVQDDYDGPVRRIYLQVKSPDDVLAVAAAASHAVGDRDGNRPRVEVAEDVAAIRAAVGGELGGAGRASVLQALAGGLALGALTIFAGVQARRRDFGRRRALGATRVQLMSLVVFQTMFVAAPGAVVGAAAGAAGANQLAGTWPGWAYPTAVATLTVLALLVAAILPATTAAFRDPVSAIRVP